MRQDFLQLGHPCEVKTRRFKIVDSLVSYVLDVIRPEHEDMRKLYQQDIKAELFKFAEYNLKGVSYLDLTQDDDIIELAELFKIEQNFLRSKELSPIFICSAEPTQLFCEQMGIEQNSSQVTSPTLLSAYKQAKKNFIAAETAMVALRVISKIVRPRNSSSKIEDVIVKECYALRKNFMLHMLLFGNLLGGKHGVEATKLVTNEMLYDPITDINYSVIQFLQEGASHPGSYLSADDKLFRNDILKHYNELTA
jgi:hypothetical protein